ncbi:MAG: adenylate kinase [Thermoproteota archaeon]|nr:adenylate kinase [Thermoproteota archaeon]
MAENKRAIIVGIPGVGKTTLISRASEMLNHKCKTTIVVFGTIMFEEAKKKMGIKNRDELRRMTVEAQRQLQDLAAQRIAEIKDDIVMIDTHVLIKTDEGYYPGLPMRLLNIMKPTNIVMVAADPSEIAQRRRSDQTRQRDIASLENIQKELEISKVMVASCSILTGAPFAIIMNNDDQVEEAAANIAKILFGDGGS